ncbi:MAG: magnesium transporter [Planctomycetota bacterium]
MINTLFLPELREMLADGKTQELADFCSALHPARVAEFMKGLSSEEAWAVVSKADLETRVSIFEYFEPARQVEILETQNIEELAELVEEITDDDRVDLLQRLEPELRDQFVLRLSDEERRNFHRLSQYPEGTAGAVMTTEVARLSESLTIREAVEEVGRQSEEYETIYYLYIVDEEEHLRGLVSARQLLEGMRQPSTPLKDIMETNLITVAADEDQEEVANKVARLDLLAIPVVDAQHRMLGIITHDDVIDVVREEATEDAHLSAAVTPLDQTYLRTPILILTWKRGIWLTILFFFALVTAIALKKYDWAFDKWTWLVFFIPLVISSGGNSGSQSATLIITALSRGHITVKDWWNIVWRELAMGLLLGLMLGLLGYLCSMFMIEGEELARSAVYVVPITLLAVVVSGTLTGSILPLVFERIGWDPALMSNPFVAGIVDIVGIVIYVNVALLLLGTA